MASAPGSCIFCGERPLTKEHMWADWLKNYIPRDMREHRIWSALIFPRSRDEEVIRRSGDPHARRIRCVCDRCNNEWMSRLQESAKPYLVPMIEGVDMVLHKRAQTSIASWATMMVMVSEFMDKTKVAVPASDRTWFKAQERPPSHWHIWIGHHDQADYSIWTHNVMTLAKPGTAPPQGNSIPPSNTQTSTILLGNHVLIHAMSSPIARHILRRWKWPVAIEPRMTRIWPIRNDASRVRWPVGDPLTGAEVHLVADQLINRVHKMAVRNV